MVSPTTLILARHPEAKHGMCKRVPSVDAKVTRNFTTSSLPVHYKLTEGFAAFGVRLCIIH